MPNNKNNLTIKQQRFVDKYLETNNASEAYRFAYKCKNSSVETIKVDACRLLKNPNIALTIEREQDKIQSKTDLSREKIIKELEIINNANIRDYCNLLEKEVTITDNQGNKRKEKIMDVQFKPFDQLTENQLKAIESVKMGRNGIELKLHSKTWSLERACKMLGYDVPAKIDVTSDGKQLNNKIEIEIIETKNQVIEE